MYFLKTRLMLAYFLAFLSPVWLYAQINITLKDTFIEQQKNRATIDAAFTADTAHRHPNAPKDDGDLHIAGRSNDVKLPIVAEIMNAAGETQAVDKIHQVEGSSTKVQLTGVWRLWCEHGGTADQVQGKSLSKFTTTNPDHVFEIHPITQLDNLDVTDGFKPIQGFTTKDAEKAFTTYENVRCSITHNASAGTTTIKTNMAGYNYVEFGIELNENPNAISDGHMVMASILTTNGDLLVHNRRIVTVKGTEPDTKLKAMKKGDLLHVLGIPRINLALVSWRASHPASSAWNLPYEIVLVGAYATGIEEGTD